MSERFYTYADVAVAEYADAVDRAFELQPVRDLATEVATEDDEWS